MQAYDRDHKLVRYIIIIWHRHFDVVDISKQSTINAKEWRILGPRQICYIMLLYSNRINYHPDSKFQLGGHRCKNLIAQFVKT